MRSGRKAEHQTAAPKSLPTPAVIAIASAPQKVTRQAPSRTPAPPTRADKPPNAARKAIDVTETQRIRPWPGINAVTAKGSAAPIAKLAADANAA